MTNPQQSLETPLKPKRDHQAIMTKAREALEFKRKHPELVLPTPERKPGIVKYEKLKRDIRKEFTDKFGAKFAHLSEKMFMMAEGYDVVIARHWEYKDGKNHRTGSWYQIEDVNEILDLMNGMDEGKDDSYYRIVTQKPSIEMLKYITDQLMGRAPQKISLDTRNKTMEDILLDIRSRNKGIIGERTPVVTLPNTPVDTKIDLTKVKIDDYKTIETIEEYLK